MNILRISAAPADVTPVQREDFKHLQIDSVTHRVELIVLYAGLAAIFQADLDLVFFDELMRTVPPQHSATFVSLAQSLQHLSAVFAPLIGTLLANQMGSGGA